MGDGKCESSVSMLVQALVLTCSTLSIPFTDLRKAAMAFTSSAGGETSAAAYAIAGQHQHRKKPDHTAEGSMIITANMAIHLEARCASVSPADR